MTCDVVVLVSVGRHPFSGRARGAELDSRALELALSLPGQVRVRVLHAGDPNEPALRDYLGSGAECVTVLQVSDTFDPLPSLVRYLADLHPTLVLTGMTAERGKCTGFLPYALAHALNFPLVSNVIALGMGAESVGVLQALPRGQRRRIEAPVPLLVMVDQAAPAPRGYAFARARRGRIEVLRAWGIITASV